MRQCSVSASLAIIFALTGPVMADGLTNRRATITPVDLDGHDPSELIQDSLKHGARALYWSAQHEAWLEILHAPVISAVAEDRRAFFGRIVTPERQWQWRNTGYVPLISSLAIPAGVSSDVEFEAALAALHVDLAESPRNNPANLTYRLRLSRSTQEIKAVWMTNTTLCSEGGTMCPLVVFFGAEVMFTALLHQDWAWGFSVRDGKCVGIEIQRPKSVTILEAVSGRDIEIEQITPVLAEDPPARPRV